MKNNLLGKKILSCSSYLNRFRKYMSYGFPIINFCNPGVHYETPCICLSVFIFYRDLYYKLKPASISVLTCVSGYVIRVRGQNWGWGEVGKTVSFSPECSRY
jgi:hypothetical protein